MNELKRYRIDKFKVPVAGWKEFFGRVAETHTFLRSCPGFVQDALLRGDERDGRIDFATIVVWASSDAMEAAKKAVVAFRQTSGFSPQELLGRLKIEADLSSYEEIEEGTTPSDDAQRD